MSNYILFTNNVLSHRFDGELWGERKISIIDPSFVWPLIEQPNSQHDPEDPASEPTILVNDPDIEPPMIEVDNPNCRVPPEAIEVSNELLNRTVNETDGVWSLVDGEIVKLPLPLPTLEQLQAKAIQSVRVALQSTIDVKAKSLGFSSGNALMLYAGFENPFRPLASVFAAWEANVWIEAESYKAEVIAGTKPMLTGEEAVALMPEYPA